MNASTLLDLTLRGSAVFALVALLDALLRTRIQARSRRSWWILAGIAFLAPIRLPVLPPGTAALLPAPVTAETNDAPGLFAQDFGGAESTAPSWWTPTQGVWLVGAAVVLGVGVCQTLRTARRWSAERLATDEALLEMLEDCKAQAGVTAPIGKWRRTKPRCAGWTRASRTNTDPR